MNRRTHIKKYVTDSIREAGIPVNIFSSRRAALQGVELPAVIVAIYSEKNDLFSQSGQEVRKTAELSIEVMVDAGLERADIEIDRMTAQIEELLHQDESLNQTIDRCILKNTEIAVIREGEYDLGMARMVYDVIYNAIPTPDESSMTDFGGVNLKFGKKEHDSR